VKCSEPAVTDFVRLPAAALTLQPLVRYRASMPGSNHSCLPHQLSGPGEEFPAVFRLAHSVAAEPTPAQDNTPEINVSSIPDAAAALRRLLDAKLPQHGALVVKGLPLESASDFSALLHATGMDLKDYVGGVTSRSLLAPKVMPASAEPAAVDMDLHNDGAYRPSPPERIILWCQVPPVSGGQALIADAREVLRRLRRDAPGHLAALERRKVRYEHFLPSMDASVGGRIGSWEEALAKGCNESSGCNSRITAEDILSQSGYDFKWSPAGLHKYVTTPPLRRHPVTGEETWMNQVSAMHCTVFANHPTFPELHIDDTDGAPCLDVGSRPYHTTFGDGQEFPRELVHAVRKAQWESAVSFDFQPGDVLVLDNFLAMHGRLSFTPPRELFISLVGGGV